MEIIKTMPLVFLLLFTNLVFNILTCAESSLVKGNNCSKNLSVKIIDGEHVYCENEGKPPTEVWIANNFGQVVRASVCGELTLTCNSTHRVTWNYDGLQVPPVSGANASHDTSSGCYSVSIKIKIDSHELERLSTGGYVCSLLEQSDQNNSTVVSRIYRTENEALTQPEVDSSPESTVRPQLSEELKISQQNRTNCAVFTCNYNFPINESDVEIAFAPCKNLLHCKFKQKYAELGADFPEEYTKSYKCPGNKSKRELRIKGLNWNVNETGIIICRLKSNKSYNIQHYYRFTPDVQPNWLKPKNDQHPPGLVAKIHNSTYYVHDNDVEPTCFASSFLYAPFPIWRVGFKDGTNITAWGNETFNNIGKMTELMQTLELNSTDISTLTCEAPHWESNGVASVTYELTVDLGWIPRITKCSPPIVTIYGTEMPRIFVEYTIKPQTPHRMWKRNNKGGVSIEESKENDTYYKSEVTLKKDSPDTWPGVYEFEISNAHGRDNRTIHVQFAAISEYGALFIFLVVAAALLILAITITCIFRANPRNAVLKVLKKAAPCLFSTSTSRCPKKYRSLIAGLERKPTDEYVKLNTTNGGMQSIFGVEEVKTVEVIGKIGEGHYGDVYVAVIDKKLAALKRMREQQREVRHSKDMLQKELRSLMTVGNHDNVITFMGALTVTIWPNEIVIVTEYCHLGDLRSYVEKRERFFTNEIMGDRVCPCYPNLPQDAARNRDYHVVGTDVSLTTTELIVWAKQLAAGLKYISSIGLIHGDVAMRNLFLDENKVLKIGDFGLSRRIQENRDYYKISNPGDSELPWLHIAPEVFRTAKISIETDVYACGVTLWEMFTLGERPYAEYNEPTEDFKLRLQNGSLQLNKPRYATTQIYNAMKLCWKMDPAERITFGQLEAEFQEILTMAEEAPMPDPDPGAMPMPNMYARFMVLEPDANIERVERVPGYVVVPNEDVDEDGIHERGGLII